MRRYGRAPGRSVHAARRILLALDGSDELGACIDEARALFPDDFLIVTLSGTHLLGERLRWAMNHPRVDMVMIGRPHTLELMEDWRIDALLCRGTNGHIAPSMPLEA